MAEFVALASPAETLNKDVVPIGDDTEPSGAPREKVELGNDEDEEPLEGSQSKTDSEESCEWRGTGT